MRWRASRIASALAPEADERELPGGQPVALGEQLGRLDRLLDREQELEPARGALGDRVEHGAAARSRSVALRSAWLKSR